MANRDTPHGLKFSHTLHGGPPRIEYSPVCNSSRPIYIGDIVLAGSTETLPCVDGSTFLNGEAIFGVAAAYNACGTTGTHLPCYTDLKNTVFKVQCDGSTGITDHSSNMNTFWATTNAAAAPYGSTVTGISYLELDPDLSGEGHLLMLVDGGLVDTPDNVWDGSHQELYVQIAQLELHDRWLTTAVT